MYAVWVSLLFCNWINAQGPVLQYRAPPDMTDKANPIRMPLNPPSSSPTAWQCHIRHRFERNNRQKRCPHSYFTSITNRFCGDFFRISLIGCHGDTATSVGVKRGESSSDDKWRIGTQGPPPAVTREIEMIWKKSDPTWFRQVHFYITRGTYCELLNIQYCVQKE